MHTFKRGDNVVVFHIDWDGKIKIEGRARVLRLIRDVDEQYRVQFLDKHGRARPGEQYERFVDPHGQADPDLFVTDMNAQMEAARAA